MAQEHPYGKAEQILVFAEKNQIIVNDAPLKQMLEHPEVKNRKIVAFSIIGAYRRGKSFFLDYCLRFLYANHKSINQQNDRQLSPQNWMGDENEALKGFSWRSGSSRDTTGILIWNDVFLPADKINGKDIAIIIFDTQGLFDKETTNRENSRIFALGTLISSIQVLNLSNNIQEDQLQYLQFATEFAKFAALDNCDDESSKPFQNLFFLIRDWQFPIDFEYGIEGGQKYLQDILEMKPNQNEEIKSIRQFLYNSFEKLECALFPYPGSKVAIDNSKTVPYDGNWGVMDEDFKNNLQKTIENLLSAEKLELKMINGSEVTCSEFSKFVSQYLILFQAEKVPEIKSIYDTMIDNHMKIFIDECFDYYKKTLAEQQNLITALDLIQVFHDMSKYKTLANFYDIKKIGRKSHAKRFKEILENNIEKQFLEWNVSMSSKIRKENKEIRLAKEEQNRIEIETKLIDAQRQFEIEKENLRKEIDELKMKSENEQNLKIQEDQSTVIIEKLMSKLYDAQKQPEIEKKKNLRTIPDELKQKAEEERNLKVEIEKQNSEEKQFHDCKWVKYIPQMDKTSLVLAATDVDDYSLFVGRVHRDGEIIPGKNRRSVFYFCHNGREQYEKYEFEVLVKEWNEKFEWIKAENGNVPNNAIVGGESLSCEKYFIGRAKHLQLIIPGYVVPSKKSILISYADAQYEKNDYEVLVKKIDD